MIPCHSEAGDGVSGLPSREYGLLDVPLDCHDLPAGWGKICYTRLPALWRVSSTEAHCSFIQVRVLLTPTMVGAYYLIYPRP